MRPVGSHPPRELCRIDSDIWGGLKPANMKQEEEKGLLFSGRYVPTKIVLLFVAFKKAKIYLSKRSRG